jgi:diguanylate cyclase (GGDEF)-like protein
MVSDGDIDGLTGVANRGSLESRLVETFTDCVTRLDSSEHKDYSVVLFDVDYFKAVNDLFGHAQGDLILESLGTILRKYRLRNQESVGIVGRWGGEEFLLVLPYVPTNRAQYIADELRGIVENHPFEEVVTGEPLQRKITISLGVSSFDLSEVVSCGIGGGSLQGLAPQINDLVAEADCALNYAKFLGRNRVEVFQRYLEEEMSNIDAVRQFYFQHASKMPAQLKGLFAAGYLSSNRRLLGKLKKHFAIIRTELQPADTRTQAVFADNLYRLACSISKQEKDSLMKFVRDYSDL